MELESVMRLENKEAVIADLKSIGIDVQGAVVETMAKSGAEIRDHLKGIFPSAGSNNMHSAPGSVPFAQTGRLRRAIRAKIMPLMLGEPISLSIFVSKKGFWGRMLEFGTSKMAARPWFFTGIAQKLPHLKDSLVSAMKGIIEKRNKARPGYVSRGRLDAGMAAELYRRDLEKLEEFSE